MKGVKKVCRMREVLAVIEQQGPQTNPQLQKKCGMHKNTVARIIGRAMDKNLVEVIQHVSNLHGRKSPVYGLTGQRIPIEYPESMTENPVALSFSDLGNKCRSNSNA